MICMTGISVHMHTIYNNFNSFLYVYVCDFFECMGVCVCFSRILYFHSLVDGTTSFNDRSGSQRALNFVEMPAIPFDSLANSGFQCIWVTGDSNISLTWMSQMATA